MYSLEKSGEILLATDRTKENQKLNEVFEEDTVPVFSSEYWCEPKTPDDVTLQFNELMQAEIRFTAKQELLNVKKTRAYLIARQMSENGLINIVGRGTGKKYLPK